jgi:hypothetical protein
VSGRKSVASQNISSPLDCSVPRIKLKSLLVVETVAVTRPENPGNILLVLFRLGLDEVCCTSGEGAEGQMNHFDLFAPSQRCGR